MRSPIPLSMLRQYCKARSKHRRGNALAEVPNHVGDEPVPLGVVHDLADERPGLAPVVVVPVQCVGSVDELAVSIPSLDVGVALRIGRRAAL